MKRFLVVIGTRPEAIKMAPVVLALRRSNLADVRLCLSGQHQGAMATVLAAFGLQPDIDLQAMRAGQGLSELAAKILTGVDHEIRSWRPNLVLVHGDTTTASAAALAAFHARAAIAHVEAGLRTHDLWRPWPEEANRRIVGMLATLHFAPTELARSNLLKESVNPSSIEVTGNTVVDALLHVRSRLEADPQSARNLVQLPDDDRRIVLVTGHRRENHGEGIEALCDALLAIADRPDVRIVYPVHPNPNVDGPVRARLGSHPSITLLPPLDYVPFVSLMARAHVILTDSGGIQEEAPALGAPVLVLRDVTERPEAVASGAVRMVGMDRDRIVDETVRLLENTAAHEAMRHGGSPYGDGRASERIAARCMHETSAASAHP
jgi:UDP-N-acetylglucosamine 2-epimerase (non-hydrolysing)